MLQQLTLEPSRGEMFKPSAGFHRRTAKMHTGAQDAEVTCVLPTQTRGAQPELIDNGPGVQEQPGQGLGTNLSS